MPNNPEPVKVIRAFGLEEEVTAVYHELLAEEPSTCANMSISSEYRVGPQLIYIYLLCPVLDVLGVCDGGGVVYYASPELEIVRERDKFAEYTISQARNMGKLQRSSRD